jgi:hypothetical protein
VQPTSDEPIVQDQPIAQDQPLSAKLPPPNSQSIVLNLNITTIEVDLILNEISSWNPLPLSLPAPFIR